jgi:N-acetylmuramic acid 6-phosphate etherase
VTRQPDAQDPAVAKTAANPNWEELPTEARHPASGDLDRLPGERIVDLLLEEDRRGIKAAAAVTREIAQAAEWIADCFSGGGSVLFAGAGTSGRLGVLEAAECPPTFGTDPARIRAVIAGGQQAVFAAREGAEDRLQDGRRAAADLGAGDLLIGVSASSVTRFVRGALDQARTAGARTVLVTCAAAETVGAAADLVLALDTGPEILTGSTRLKAGSATKAVLNAMTTSAMVQVGKVFENLMVDLRPGSAKLADRALRIIQAAGGVTRERAASLHREADGEVKTAIVMARRAIGAGEARHRLARSRGHVRQAVSESAGQDRAATERPLG